MKRRRFILGLAGAGLLGGIYAWQIEPFWLEFTRVKMPIKNLPKGLSGKILMQISDIHVGDQFDHTFIIQSFKKAQEFQPDFVVYTGDYISSNGEEMPFRKLTEVLTHCVKGKLGTFGILGNHDYGKNWTQAAVADTIVTQLTQAGISVLRNEQYEKEGLHFIGLDDYWGLNFKPHPILRQHDSSKPTIVLCHNPDVCDLEVWNNYQGWILAGHTHGGQVKPPFLDPPILPVTNKNYTAGLFALPNERTLYINRALGHLVQIRFNVKPEITLFELMAS